MNINPRPELQRRIDERMASGQFDSVEVLFEHALLALDWQDEAQAPLMEQLKESLQAACEQAERGETTPWDYEAMKKRFHQEYEERHGKTAE